MISKLAHSLISKQAGDGGLKNILGYMSKNKGKTALWASLPLLAGGIVAGSKYYDSRPSVIKERKREFAHEQELDRQYNDWEAAGFPQASPENLKKWPLVYSTRW